MIRRLLILVAFVATLGVAASAAAAQSVTTPPQHVSLGFDARFPFSANPSDGNLAGSYSFNINGTARIVTALGATLDATYDRADLVPGGSVPVSLRYTPTNDAGNEFSLSVDGSITGDVTVLAVIELLNVDINANLLSGGASFTAPLAGDPSIVVPLSSPAFPGEFLGFHVFDVQMTGNATLGPVGPGILPGLGGAVAGVSAIGATLTSPGLGVVEWDAPGASAAAAVTLSGSTSPITVRLSPALHWLDTAASLGVQFDWVGVFDVLPDIPTVPVFSGSLGPVYTMFGLDCLIASAIDGGPCGGLIGAQVAANIAAGRLPIPLLTPPGAVVPPIPGLGRVDFTIDPDADNDFLFDGTEITGSNPTNPDDSDSDDDVLLDGEEDTNRNGAWDSNETNPNDPDTDGEGLEDGCEVLGANPTNPLLQDTDGDGLTDAQEDVDRDCARDATETDPNNPDTDGDGLNDGVEVATGTDPLNPDSDGDGIPDGQDVEFIENAISALPASDFKGAGNQTAMLSKLAAVNALVVDRKVDQALTELNQLLVRVDGCGATADSTDWIVNCTSQVTIRGYINLLITNLTP